MSRESHRRAAVLLAATVFIVGCGTPCGHQTHTPTLDIVDQMATDTEGQWLYSSFHGFRTETVAVWRGKNASVTCWLLGDGTNRGIAIARSYFRDGMQIRSEVAVSRNPMILSVAEYDPRSGERTNSDPHFVHQEEASVFFESFIREHGLEKELRQEGAKKAVDFLMPGRPLKEKSVTPTR